MNKDMESIRDEWRELRSRIGNLVCAVDGKVESCEALDKKMQEKKDESYLKGAEDMREVLRILLSPDISYGMPMKKIVDAFGTPYNSSILEKYSASEIINKVNQWKEEQQEPTCRFTVGDEIKCIEPLSMNHGMRYVVLRTGDEMELLDPNTFTVHYSDNFGYYNKTGKHYDSIPIPVSKEGDNK